MEYVKNIGYALRGLYRITICAAFGHIWEFHIVGDVYKKCKRCKKDEAITDDELKTFL